MRLESIINKAYEIAVHDLTACYTKHGILTGLHHFTDYWARDSMYACLGALCLANPDNPKGKHLEVVRLNLDLLAQNQDKCTGQIPFRVGSKIIFQKMLGIKGGTRRLKPCFKQDKCFLHPFNDLMRPTDPNVLFLIISSLYFQMTNDRKLLDAYFDKYEKAIQWCFNKEKGELMVEGLYSTWEDTVGKKGVVLYTNVLYYAALKSFSVLLEMKERNSKDYQKRAKKLKNAINQNFWTGRYYLDWIDKGVKHDIFSTDGNLLAILFGVSNKNQSSAIQRHIKKKRINHPWVSKTNDNPDERQRYVSRLNKLLGIGEYHNRWVWPWLGCIDASVKSRMGEKNEAKRLLAKIAQSIVRDKTCHEVYDQKGNPVKTGLWLGNFGLGFKSEAPYAWTAGLYIFSYHQIFHPTNTVITSFDKIF